MKIDITKLEKCTELFLVHFEIEHCLSKQQLMDVLNLKQLQERLQNFKDNVKILEYFINQIPQPEIEKV